jgi:hypothetical protein
MKDRYGGFKASDMVTLNETDEYQSEFRTCHKVVLFDDIGASRYGLNDTSNPWRKVIDFVNNIKKTALNPNVEMKGKVYIEPDVVILTTNLDMTQTGSIAMYIPALEAIYRRFNCVFKVLSHTHVVEARFEKAEQKITPGVESHSIHGIVAVETEARAQAIERMRVDFREHMEDQTRFVDHFNSYFDSSDGTDESEVIYESQSGARDIDPEELDIAMEKVRFAYLQKYYKTAVNWDAYYSEYGRIVKDDHDSLIKMMEHGRIDLYNLEKGGSVLQRGPFNAALQEWASEKQLPLFHLEDYRYKLRAESTNSKVKFSLLDYQRRVSLTGDAQKSFTRLKADLSVIGAGLKLRKFRKNGALTVLPLMEHPNLKECAESERFLWCWLVHIMHVQTTIFGTNFEQLSKFLIRSQNPIAQELRGKISRAVIRKYYAFCVVDLYKDLAGTPQLEEPVCASVNIADDGEPDKCLIDIFDDAKDNLSVVSTGTMKSTKSNSSRSQESEAEQIERVAQLIPDRGNKPLVHRNIALCNYGEIDLVVDDGSTILVIECKRSTCDISRGCEQARRYSNVMAALRPEQRVIGLLYSPFGFRVVTDYNEGASRSYAQFLSALGYDP